MKVVGYVRVSVEESSHGCSLSAQEEKIRSYCGLYGICLLEIVRDDGQNARTLNRPGLQRALSMLDDGKAAGICISKLDRLSRSVRDMAALIDRYFGGNASLLSVEDKIDTQTAAGRVVLNLLTCLSQWERETIGERTSQVLRHKMEKEGIRVGAPMLGYQVKEGRLIEDPEELRAVTLALNFRRQMMPYQQIADEFIRLGIPTKRGGQWHSETIRQIIRRHYREETDGTKS